MLKRWHRLTGSAPVIWLLACSEGSERPVFTTYTAGTDATEAAWCSTLCGTHRRCEGSVSSTCQVACEQENRAYFDRSSQAALEFQSDCLQNAACTEEFDDLLGNCLAATVTALEPSPAAKALCEVMGEAFFECNWFASPQSCAVFHAGYSEAALASVQACAGASCADLDACVEAQLFADGE